MASTHMQAHGTWHNGEFRSPAVSAVHVVALHPNATQYFAYWRGDGWATPAANARAAFDMREHAFTPPAHFWFQSLKGTTMFVPRTSAFSRGQLTGNVPAPKRAGGVRGKQQAPAPAPRKPRPNPLARHCIRIPGQAPIQPPVVVEWWPITDWQPTEPGDFEVLTTKGVECRSRWTGQKFTVRNVTHWHA